LCFPDFSPDEAAFEEKNLLQRYFGGQGYDNLGNGFRCGRKISRSQRRTKLKICQLNLKFNSKITFFNICFLKRGDFKDTRVGTVKVGYLNRIVISSVLFHPRHLLLLVIPVKQDGIFEEVVTLRYPGLNKKRKTVQEIMASIQKNLGRLLARSARKFEHDKVPRLRVQAEDKSVKNHKMTFKIQHKAYIQNKGFGKDEIKDETKEKTSEDLHKCNGHWESLYLFTCYEESYKI
jgi:hypothetical protein